MGFAARPSFRWQMRTRAMDLGTRTRLMGILNVTPDSFSDGGRFLDPEPALAQGVALLEAGADLVDVGGESTRPGAVPLSATEEQARLLPVLEALRRERPEVVLSVDTYHASTAQAAVRAGAEIVNDVSGLLWDVAMPATVAQAGAGLVLMHTRATPQTWSTLPPLAHDMVVALVMRELRTRVAAAEAAGIARARIVLDPGFGFGKLGGENLTLLAGFSELAQIGLPLLAGLSRKGFLARVVEAAGPAGVRAGAAPDRLSPTLAANVAAILAGAHVLRVHAVAPAREAAAIADAVLAEGAGE